MQSTSYGRQLIDDEDIQMVSECLRGGILTGGEYVLRFEQALAHRTQALHSTSCNSGTAGLHLAMMALGIGPDDIVIVPALTFVASANCVRYLGGQVCLADVDPDTGLMTPQTLRDAIAEARIRFGSKRLAAVVAVHLNGQTEDVAGLSNVCKEHGAAFVIDACHALGTTWGPDNEPVGSAVVADCEVFSFHPVKTIAMGEGGAVTTRDPILADKMRLLRSHGITRNAELFEDAQNAYSEDGNAQPWHYEMLDLGLNYRVSDINCALGLSQLGKLDSFIAHRRSLLSEYRERFADLAPLVTIVPDTGYSSPCWHLASALIDFDAIKTPRSEVMALLKDQGIGTQVHYIPIFRHPYWARYLAGAGQQAESGCPGAVAYFDKQLSLPLHLQVTTEHVECAKQVLQQLISN